MSNFARPSPGPPELQVPAGPGRDAAVRAACRGERPEAGPYLLHFPDVDTALCQDCAAGGVSAGREGHQGVEQQDLQGQARLHPGGQAHSSAQKVGDNLTEKCPLNVITFPGGTASFTLREV